MIDPAERDIFESFARLYRNANKGIKGRGKDRKVGGAGSGGGSSGSVNRVGFPEVGMEGGQQSPSPQQHQLHPPQHGSVPVNGMLMNHTIPSRHASIAEGGSSTRGYGEGW